MLGIRLKARPSADQKLTLSQWMGCGRFIWNAKCQEHKYLSTFAVKYLPVGTYAPHDATYSQYKDSKLSPWLKDCPSQILRNSASNWLFTFQDFLKGRCGKPKVKKKDKGGSIYLTNELFRFESGPKGALRLFIGTKRNNIGFLSFVHHGPFSLPKSIYIKKKNGNYWIAFCYQDERLDITQERLTLSHLQGASEAFLQAHTIGVDRGVVRPVQAGDQVFDLTDAQKKKKRAKELYLKRQQRRLSRQVKGSNRRSQNKRKVGRSHEKVANIRKDFCHKTSHAIVNRTETKIIVFEDLKTKNMTKAPRPKRGPLPGKWSRNGARAKAGLNRSILDKGWGQIEIFTRYKAEKAGKAFFKVSSAFTSQECADCSHIHPDNRKSQSLFVCESCGHSDNADHNAAEVIKKRAIKLLLHSGTELSERGVLLDIGRGVVSKTGRAKSSERTRLRSVKKEEACAS